MSDIKNKQQKKNELEEWKSLALRLKADYQNREREIAEEKKALRGLIEEHTVLDFLPILDNLKKAILSLCHSREGGNSVNEATLQGLQYVIKQFEDKLSSLGIEKIDLLGHEFNPKFAEAVEQKGEGNNVIEVLVDGYKKDDKIIRAGRVIVG